MRPRTLVDGASIVGVTLTLGWILSLATTRVKNWFVMTDELYYERLAVSVAQTGSLLPRLHGELVSNVNQLYPVLISTVYGDGDVAASLEAAHRLNAFLIASAAIPVFLLARRLGVGTLLSLWAGALSVAVPWIVLSSFLLTENVAYPMFCWAVLALTYAVGAQAVDEDLLALAAIGAGCARADAVHRPPRRLRRRGRRRGDPRDLVAGRRRASSGARAGPSSLLYGALLLVVLAAIAIGKGSKLLGSYSVTAENVRLDFGLVQLIFEHVAALALGLAILPFIVGCAWLIDRCGPRPSRASARSPSRGRRRWCWCSLQVASFNQRFGAGLVNDRYLFYVVPWSLLGLAAACRRAPLAALVGVRRPGGRRRDRFRLDPRHAVREAERRLDVAILNRELMELATTTRWAHVLLVLRSQVVAAGAAARAGVPALAAGRRDGRGPGVGRAAARGGRTPSTGSSQSTGRTGCR